MRRDRGADCGTTRTPAFNFIITKQELPVMLVGMSLEESLERKRNETSITEELKPRFVIDYTTVLAAHKPEQRKSEASKSCGQISGTYPSHRGGVPHAQ